MDRRHFLWTAAGAVAASSLAGCLGYDVVRSQRIDRLESAVADREDRIDTLTEQAEQREQRISDLESAVRRARDRADTAEDDVAALEADLSSARRQHLVTLYELADGHYAAGTADWNDALDAVDQRDWPLGTAHAARAEGSFNDAWSVLDEVVVRVEEMGEATARALAADGQTHNGLMGEAANTLANAMVSYQDGDAASGNELWNEADALQREASRTPFPTVDRFENALGS